VACQDLTEEPENVDQSDPPDLPDFPDPEVQADVLEHPVDRDMQDDQESTEPQEPPHPEDPDQLEHPDHQDHPARTPVIIWSTTVRMTEHQGAQQVSTSYGRDILLCTQLEMDKHAHRILENLDLVFRSSVPSRS